MNAYLCDAQTVCRYLWHAERRHRVIIFVAYVVHTGLEHVAPHSTAGMFYVALELLHTIVG